MSLIEATVPHFIPQRRLYGGVDCCDAEVAATNRDNDEILLLNVTLSPTPLLRFVVNLLYNFYAYHIITQKLMCLLWKPQSLFLYDHQSHHHPEFSRNTLTDLSIHDTSLLLALFCLYTPIHCREGRELFAKPDIKFGLTFVILC